VKNQEIIPLYDYDYTYRKVRNNLLKDLVINKFQPELEKQFASWNDIVIIYEIDKYSFLKQRQMPKLTDKHVIRNVILKIRVKYVTEVISHVSCKFYWYCTNILK